MSGYRIVNRVRIRANTAGWRWAVVIIGVAALCSLPVLASALPVSAPNLTPEQLKARILASQSIAFSGYAESNATFGLPPLGAFSSVASLLDGITKMQVWQASPTSWRVDTLSDASERDTYQLGPATQYTWDSQQLLLTEITGRQAIRLPVAADLVPSSLAVRAIKEAGPQAKLSVLPPRRVAGQDAAGLRIVPADRASTVGRIDIWANPGTGIPLRVEITARGATQPALETQFFQVSPWRPDAELLTPRHAPNTGFTVTSANDLKSVLSNLLGRPLPAVLDGRARTSTPVPGAAVYGSGLAPFAVLAIRGGFGLIDNAVSAGATSFDVGYANGASASAPLVNLVLVHEARSPSVYLLAGLVTRTVLMRAALELIAQT
jgi:hypothetical protein